MRVEAMINEPAVISRLATGDESAFESLFLHYKDRIYSIAHRLCQSDELAQEIVQDIFMKVWFKRAELTAIKSFKNWLFIISRNQIYNVLAHQARHRAIVRPWNDQLTPSLRAESELPDNEYVDLLRQAVETLPPGQQEVYRLFYQQQLKKQEIADQLGISINTVKVQLHRANVEIRQYCLSRLPAGILLLLLTLSK